MATIFRPYSESEALRSDRSAGDRARHRAKVRDAIRRNIADLVAEESIIGKAGDRIVRVPIRGVREYRFVYGENTPGVGTGTGGEHKGQVVGKAGPGRTEAGVAGDQPGVDYYETDITVDELVEIMFEDLELPEMERKNLRQDMSDQRFRRKGHRLVGVHAHLDKRRTALERIRRRLASARAAETDQPQRFPFHRDDLRYRHHVESPRMTSNAAVICIMDTSGSMDTMKKYLARSFFFLLYRFVCTRYQYVEVVFVAHHAEAQEVTEDDFFHKGESGGTMISSGYRRALEIIADRYHPALWNVYAFHCSDGDNFPSDKPATLAAATELCEVCNLFGYGEIRPHTLAYESSMLEEFAGLGAHNFKAVLIRGREDIWPGFKALLARERAAA